MCTNTPKTNVCYYSFLVWANNLTVPYIETYMYLGENIYDTGRCEVNGEKVYYFQMASYYIKKMKAESESELIKAGIIQVTEDQIESMVELCDLLPQLIMLKRDMYRQMLGI